MLVSFAGVLLATVLIGETIADKNAVHIAFINGTIAEQHCDDLVHIILQNRNEYFRHLSVKSIWLLLGIMSILVPQPSPDIVIQPSMLAQRLFVTGGIVLTNIILVANLAFIQARKRHDLTERYNRFKAEKEKTQEPPIG